MKLKTLKDLVYPHQGFALVREDVLKEEAIKWVKNAIGRYKGDIGALEWLEFFNITDEELSK